LVAATFDVARGQGSLFGVAVASRARAAIRWRRDDLLGAEADALAGLELLADEPGAASVAPDDDRRAPLLEQAVAALEPGRAPPRGVSHRAPR
jgi:hypothetical protein